MAFYRTVIEVEVLSEDPYVFNSLSNIAHDIRDGDCSGKVTVISQEEVSPDKMAELLTAQGSDPSFLLGEE